MLNPADNREYVRVTEILRPLSGIDSVPKEILMSANERGSRVHALCDGIIQGVDIIVPDEFKGYLESFYIWHQGKEFLANPGRMYDAELMVTGECDGLCVVNGNIFIFDLKTSQRESKTWKLQGAAYSYLMKKPYPQVFVILDKKGGEPIEFIYEGEDNVNDFKVCADLYHKYVKPNKKLEVEYL